jgi:hypothetical protein
MEADIIALYAIKSLLLLSSLKTRLLYPPPESLPLAIHAERRSICGIRGKELLYKK